MRKIYLISFCAACAQALFANGKIDLASQEVLSAYKEGKLSADIEKAVFMAPMSRGGAPLVKVLVETDGSLPADMPYNYYRLSSTFYTVDIPADQIEVFSENTEVVTMSFGKVASSAMDIARGECAVSSVHTGRRLAADGRGTKPHKGEGVVAGVYDSGFDPSHVNWLSADGSSNRLQYYLRTTSGFQEYYGDEASKALTDDAGETHGTHVAGIMAGAYNGKGIYYGTQSVSKPVAADNVPLYGVAPEAELAVGAGSLTTASILEGVSRIVKYARKQGKPVVVNLSLGNNVGPHDGTDSDVRQLDQLVDETGAIIVIAAGNDGDIACHAGKTFTASDKKLTVLFNNNSAKRYVDVWSSDETPITVSVVAVDAKTGQVMAKISSVPSQTVTVGSGTEQDDEFFKTNFKGSATLRAAINGINRRYNVYFSPSGIEPTTENGGNYLLGLMVEGNEGVRVDAYATEYTYFATSYLPGVDAPDMNGSISGLACGKRTICVGSFNTRNSWFTNLGQGPISYGSGAALGAISDFSSWGELIDGRKLPHITAPGMAIASSYNTSYVSSGANDPLSLIATADVDGKTNYWGILQGTSMACPYVAGVMALWLQADPNLSLDSARDIIASTATTTGLRLDTKWGAGKIDAYSGIREVLSRKTSGIGNVSVCEDDDFMVRSAAGGVEVFAAGAGEVCVELYTVGGALAARVVAAGDTAVLPTEGLAKGVYVLRGLADGTRTVTRKIAL